MKHIIFKLKDGEMHQSKISDLKDYRIIRFDDYKLITTAQGFGFEQSEEGVLTRGDRELHISDMKEFVYQFTKCILEKNDELAQIYAPGSEFTVEQLIKFNETGLIPLHDGVIRYLKEVGKM